MSTPQSSHGKLLWNFILISALLLVIVAVLAWVGTYLWWEFRLKTSILEWEGSFEDSHIDIVRPTMSDEQSELFRRAGCRAVPYLLDRMNSSSNAWFQQYAMTYVLFALMGPKGDRESVMQFERWEKRWLWDGRATPVERSMKLADFNEWWKENGRRYHKPWRVWSSWCPGE